MRALQQAPDALPATPIDLTVIGGFLGAGKTTLVNRLLRDPGHRKLTVLVNDFGSINIDAALIRARHGDTIELSNGCVCCSIGGDLMSALLDLERRMPRPEHLVIETSGVADPWKVAQIGLIAAGYRLNAVIVVVDAESLPSQLADTRIGETVQRQFLRADLIVLNKVDLVDDEKRQRLRETCQSHATGAVIVDATDADVPANIIFDAVRVDGVSAELPRTVSADGVAPDTADAAERPALGRPKRLSGARNAERPDGPGSDRFDSLSIDFVVPMPRARVQDALARAVSHGVIRGKGLFQFADTGECWSWQRVGRREQWKQEPLALAHAGLCSRVVMIGLLPAFDAAQVSAALDFSAPDRSAFDLPAPDLA